MVKAEVGVPQGAQVSESVKEEETYWIHFSDGETIINSQEVVYGTAPQFLPYQVQEGYVFLGWKYYISESQYELIAIGYRTLYIRIQFECLGEK